MRTLTDTQIQNFNENGYLLVEDALAPEDLNPLIAEFEEIVNAGATQLYENGELNSPYETEGFDTRLAKITEQSPVVFQKLFSGAHTGPALFKLLVNPKLLDIAESLVGPEIMCHPAYRVRPKLPEHERTLVPWHQDAGYMEPACDTVLQLTIWIPLIDATVENGCLEVIPHAHRDGVFRHRRVKGKPYLDIPPKALPDVEPVVVPVNFGSVLLFTNLTPHRSIPNISNQVRWSVDARYQDASKPTGYQPEAGFLARSRKNPETVVTSPTEFKRIRDEHQPGPGPQRWTEEEIHDA